LRRGAKASEQVAGPLFIVVKEGVETLLLGAFDLLEIARAWLAAQGYDRYSHHP
jgi:hypothetical protein